MGMRTHRGINLSNVVGEGLSGLPGVLIAAFFAFVMVGAFIALLAGVLEPFVAKPFVVVVNFGENGMFLAFLLTEAAACAVYVLSQRRDKRVTARILEELHKLNEAGSRESGTSAVADMDADALRAWHGHLGLADFKAEELRRAARPSGVSPEGLLIVVLGLLFVAGMADIFIPLGYEEELIGGFVSVAVGAGIGYVFHRLRVRRDAGRVARELEL